MTVLNIWPTESGPVTFSPASAGKTLSTEFYLTSGSWWLTQFRIWRGAWDMTGPFYARLYVVNSPASGTAVANTDVKIRPRGLGWQVGKLTNPVLLTAGPVYRAVYWTPDGATYSPSYW